MNQITEPPAPRDPAPGTGTPAENGTSAAPVAVGSPATRSHSTRNLLLAGLIGALVGAFITAGAFLTLGAIDAAADVVSGDGMRNSAPGNGGLPGRPDGGFDRFPSGGGTNTDEPTNGMTDGASTS